MSYFYWQLSCVNEQKLTDRAVYPDGYLGMKDFLQIISRSLILGDFLFSL